MNLLWHTGFNLINTRRRHDNVSWGLNIVVTVTHYTSRRKLLQISDGIDQPDGIVWQLAVSLLVIWMVCYFCIWKGIRWTGKVGYEEMLLDNS